MQKHSLLTSGLVSKYLRKVRGVEHSWHGIFTENISIPVLSSTSAYRSDILLYLQVPEPSTNGEPWWSLTKQTGQEQNPFLSVRKCFALDLRVFNIMLSWSLRTCQTSCQTRWNPFFLLQRSFGCCILQSYKPWNSWANRMCLRLNVPGANCASALL